MPPPNGHFRDLDTVYLTWKSGGYPFTTTFVTDYRYANREMILFSVEEYGQCIYHLIEADEGLRDSASVLLTVAHQLSRKQLPSLWSVTNEELVTLFVEGNDGIAWQDLL